MHACLRPGGACLITMRDYEREERGKGIIKPYGVREDGDKRYLVFQVWDWDEDQYDLTMYFVEEDRSLKAVQTHAMRTSYELRFISLLAFNDLWHQLRGRDIIARLK